MKLRELTEADRNYLLDLLTSEQINKTYMLPDFPCREDALPLARRLMELSRDDSRFLRGMEEKGCLVGFLNDVEIQNGIIELGYAVHPDHWNKGFATAALKLAIDDLFAMGYRKILCGAFAENPASLRCMEKAGMKKLSKTDEIEYRGTLHRCIYYTIENPKQKEPGC